MQVYLRSRLFDQILLSPTYSLGNKNAIIHMLRKWDSLDNSLAMKIFFREHPATTLTYLFLLLLVASSYSIRVAEAPINQYHSTYFWNQMVFSTLNPNP